MHNKQINLIASRDPQENLLVMFFLLMVVPASFFRQSSEFTPILLSQLSYIRFCGYVATFYSRRKSQAEEEGVKNLHDRNKGNKER